MILLFIIVLMCVEQSYGMQNELDVIEQDYAVLAPYMIKMLKVTKDDFTPFELLKSLTCSDALINSQFAAIM